MGSLQWQPLLRPPSNSYFYSTSFIVCSGEEKRPRTHGDQTAWSGRLRLEFPGTETGQAKYRKSIVALMITVKLGPRKIVFPNIYRLRKRPNQIHFLKKNG